MTGSYAKWCGRTPAATSAGRARQRTARAP
jgi:hypothetical protein